MLAIGTGDVVSNQNVTLVQTNATVAPVTATDFKLLEGKHIKTDRDTEMMPIDEYLQKTAEWNTVPNPYKLKGHNNIKFHWYKKRMYAMLGTIQICIGHKHLVLMMQYKQTVKLLSQEQQL